MLLPHIAARLYGTPLLIARSKLDVILSVLGDRVGWPEPQSALPMPLVKSASLDAPMGIAVIPIYGTLVRRAVGLEAASGLTSYGEIAAMIETAVNDPAINGILIEVDSPGGEAGGMFELARQIRAADAVKPIWAIASDSAYSAAYALASSASRLYVTETAGVGSIGVIAMHVDQSVRDAQAGYRYTAITAGDQKNDFSPHEPLDAEAASRLKAEVDRLYGMFVDHVATMRGLEARFIRSTQAGLYFGADAVNAGLADAEGSFSSVVQDFSTYLATKYTPVQNSLQRASRSSPLQPKTHTHSINKETHAMADEVIIENEQPSADPKPESEHTETHQDDTDQTKPIPVTATDTDAAVKSAIAATRADAVAIAELCQLAGQPQRIAGFLANGTSETDVRKALLASRAEGQEIQSHLHPDAVSQAASTDHNPLMKAVKKLTGKE
jgi:signal peptide peptidase SppA